MERYQFIDGNWQAEGQPGHWTQWGLTHDDQGKLFWIDNTRPLKAARFSPEVLENGSPVGQEPACRRPRFLG